MSRRQLQDLPLRALVAFVTRCAQRLRPVLELRAEPPSDRRSPRRPRPGAAAPVFKFKADSAIRVGCLLAGGETVPAETAAQIESSFEELAPRFWRTSDTSEAALFAAHQTAIVTAHAARAIAAAAPIVEETLFARVVADDCYRHVVDVRSLSPGLVFRRTVEGNVRDSMDLDIRRLAEQTAAKAVKGDAIGPPIDVSLHGPLNGHWTTKAPRWYMAGRRRIDERREFLSRTKSQLIARGRQLDADDLGALRQLCEGLGHSWSVSNDDWEHLSVASLALRWEMIWRVRADFPEMSGQLPGDELSSLNPFLLLGDVTTFFSGEGNEEAAALLESALEIDVLRPRPLPADWSLEWLDDRMEERFSRVLLRGEMESSLAILRTYIAVVQQSSLVDAESEVVDSAIDAARRARRFSDDLAPLLALAFWRARSERLDPLLQLIEETADQAGLSGQALRKILELDLRPRDVVAEFFLIASRDAADRQAEMALASREGPAAS